MGIWFNQADHFIVPSDREIAGTVLGLAQMEAWTRKNAVLSGGLAFEQFVDHVINERFFQPLALATMGWASRVSISELAQNAVRLGPVNLFAARLAASATKQNWKISTQEMPHLVAMVRGVMAGVDESAVKALGKERLMDAAVASAKMFDGHIVHPALDSTHAPMSKGTDMPDMAVADVRARNRRQGVLADQSVGNIKIKSAALGQHYTALAPGQSGYFRSWSENLGRIAHDQLGEVVAKAYHDALPLGDEGATSAAIEAARRYLDSLPEKDISHMGRHYATSLEGARTGLDPHQDWAIQATAALKGAIHGQDGTLHTALLNDIVDKQVLDTKGMVDTYSKLDATKLPKYIPGREVQYKTSDAIIRLTNSLHKNLLGPIVNELSREPTWVVDFANERKLLEGKVKLGEMTQDQADVLGRRPGRRTSPSASSTTLSTASRSRT